MPSAPAPKPSGYYTPKPSNPYLGYEGDALLDEDGGSVASGTVRARPSASDRLAAAEAARAAHDAKGGYGGYDPYDAYAQGAHARGRATAAPRARRSVPARKLRFWKWYRTLPIVALLLVGAASLVVNLGLFGIKEWLYPVRYESAIAEAAEEWGVDPLLIASIIRTESSWDPKASSAAGAQGLMQLMPETAAELAERGLVDPSVFDPENLLDPATNIAYGTAYLAYCLQNTESVDQAIAAYNAGVGAAQDWASSGSSFAESIAYPETTSYLERVESALRTYQETYPEGIQP